MERKITKESVLAILFLILTFSTFFMKGMFFEGEQFLYFSLLGILGILSFILIPTKSYFGKSLDWFSLGIVILYAISCLQALYLRNAVVEMLKYSVALIAYLLSKKLLQDKKEWFFVTVYVAGVLMSLIGLGAASGLYFISGAYIEEKNLVSSLFQYHNTSAVLLSVVFIFGLSLYARASKLWMKLLISAGNMIALLTVVFSASRGTWVLLPFLLIFYYLLLPKEDRHLSVPVLGTIVSALVIMRGCGNALAERNTAVALVYMLVSVLLSLVLSYLLEKVSHKLTFTKKHAIVTGISLLVLFCLLVLFGKFLLPQSIVERITSFTMESRTITERLTFYKDAFTIFKDYPLLGIGGGGWPYIYREYQSYGYLANSPHSFLLHLMVETGLLGIFLFLFLFITLLRSFVKLLKSDAVTKRIYAPILVSLGGIFVHSLFDIDFSYYTVTILVWMMLALISDIEANKTEQKKISFRWLAVFCSLIISICGFTGKIAWDSYYHTAEYMNTDSVKAYESVSRALQLDPGNTMYAITKGDIGFHLAAEQQNQTKMRMYLDESKEAFERAYRYNPRDHMLVQQLSTFYVNTGQFQKGCDMVENLIKLTPFYREGYFHLSSIYITVAEQYLQNNDRTGYQALERLANLWDETDAYFENRGVRFEMNRATKDNILLAKRILGAVEELKEK